ncbi:hypothetical protein CBM2633_B60197 [Cupriavidus taiwanensis]|nr:hypothetical protein CBM2633_B60197 [Cupriavidus taiwanensis]
MTYRNSASLAMRMVRRGTDGWLVEPAALLARETKRRRETNGLAPFAVVDRVRPVPADG